MLPLAKGRYTARVATSPQDIARAQALRHLCFVANRDLVTGTSGTDTASADSDHDAFDDRCVHILIEDTASHLMVCCYRLLSFASGIDITSSYSAQFYDLSRLCKFPGAMLELGRFCIHPHRADPDILRLAWAALTRLVDAGGVAMLFGCTSFDGTDPAKYQDALALLKDRHLAPSRWRPGIKFPDIYPYAKDLHDIHPSPNRGLAALPSLLRTYVTMGGWVSDHALIDTKLNTLHVFTGLEINAIPPARARLLRSLAA